MIYEEIEIGAIITDGVKVAGSLVIKRIDENAQEAFIPLDEGNADYQAYLAYLAEQETA